MSASRNEFESIVQVNGIYRVNSIEQIKNVIHYAKQHNQTVRVLGSEHSPALSIYSNSENELKIKLEGRLKNINSFVEEESENSAFVRVGAGCHLGVDPSDRTSTLENSFNYQIDQLGWALPTLGGITHQTIAGFMSTSSSGGTAIHNIADAIEAIGFVDGMGTYRYVKLFNAVGVSMGLFGVITDVTFKLKKKYFVQGNEINQEMKHSCLAGDTTSHYDALEQVLFIDNEYAHIN